MTNDDIHSTVEFVDTELLSYSTEETLAEPKSPFPEDKALTYIRTEAPTTRQGDYLTVDSNNKIKLSEIADRSCRWRLLWKAGGDFNEFYRLQHVETGLFLVLSSNFKLKMSKTSKTKAWQTWKTRSGPCRKVFSMRWITPGTNPNYWLITKNNGSVTAKKFNTSEKCLASWDFELIG
ncbi:MAG: hypothetical protein KDI82_02705 [Gammaproteobacteria bacterium]|nr:hypothetical protein [Gammaproteobacteria bacterium]